MDVTPHAPKEIIEAYGDNGFKVGGQRYEGSVLVHAGHITNWSATDWAAIQPEDFAALLQTEPLPEVVVVGCGKRFEMLPKAIRQLFRNKAIPVEAMDTGTACRTYNILLGEGRRVAAALIAV